MKRTLVSNLVKFYDQVRWKDDEGEQNDVIFPLCFGLVSYIYY